MAQDLLLLTELTKHQQTGRPREREPFPLASRPFVRRSSRFAEGFTREACEQPKLLPGTSSHFGCDQPSAAARPDQHVAGVAGRQQRHGYGHRGLRAGDQRRLPWSRRHAQGGRERERPAGQADDRSPRRLTRPPPAMPPRPGRRKRSGHGACRTLGDHLWRREHRARQTGLGRAGPATSADGRSALARSATCGASTRPSIFDHPMAPAAREAPDRSAPPCALSVRSPRGHDGPGSKPL